MNNDKDGARWRMWCRILAGQGEPECQALAARLAKVPKDIEASLAIDAMNAAMDEVIELFPDPRAAALQELVDQAQELGMGY